MTWPGGARRKCITTLIIPLKVCLPGHAVDRKAIYCTHWSLKQDFKTMLIDLFVEGKPLEDVEAEDKEEEEEAKNIQKRLAANLSEEDYDLSLLQVHFIHGAPSSWT